MSARPSKSAEALVEFLTPPACREEVLGDLYERYQSPKQYALEAFRTIPFVILSRVRRTADAQLVLLQAMALYLSFLCAAWFADRQMLHHSWGSFRLAIPGAVAMIGLLLEDAYAPIGYRSTWNLVRGPAIGVGLALLSQGLFRTAAPTLAIPLTIAFYGCAMSLLVSSALRLLFPPTTNQMNQLQSANTPAFWLKQPGPSDEMTQGLLRIAWDLVGMAATLTVGIWLADFVEVPQRVAIPTLLMLLVGYQVWKRTLRGNHWQ